jgi:hypothetical protein
VEQSVFSHFRVPFGEVEEKGPFARCLGGAEQERRAFQEQVDERIGELEPQTGFFSSHLTCLILQEVVSQGVD